MAHAIVRPDLDDAAFARLLAQQRPRLLAMLRRLCGDDAEDVVQETLTKAWRLREGFDSQRNGEGWLVRAAFRTLCDYRAARHRRRDREPPSVEPAAPVVANALEVKEEVARLLQLLPALERDLVVGFHAHGLSLKELAERHSLPLNTVKSRLHRARARLAAAPEDDHDAC